MDIVCNSKFVAKRVFVCIYGLLSNLCILFCIMRIVSLHPNELVRFTPVTKSTGQGFINQTDWSGGSGQATSTDLTQYLSSDGNIANNSPAGELTLAQVFGEYVSSGVLTSSSFDIGSPANFQKIGWNPTSQPPQSGTPTVRFQIATNNDGGVWNFTGPDGTSGTYYTVGDQNIHSSNNSKQYLRYKLFLDSASTTTTPNISDVHLLQLADYFVCPTAQKALERVRSDCCKHDGIPPSRRGCC
jgi:hypothetical protein